VRRIRLARYLSWWCLEELTGWWIFKSWQGLSGLYDTAEKALEAAAKLVNGEVTK